MRIALLLVVLALVGCDKRSSPAPKPQPPAATDAATADAAPTPTLETVDGLWDAYRTLHTAATQSSAETIGRAIDALLSEDARAIITQAADQSVGALPTTLSIKSSEVRYKLLGEGAVARAALITAGTITVSETDASHALITMTSGGKTLVWNAVKEDAGWRFAPSPDLLVKEDDLFALPAGASDPKGGASADAIAAAWVAALNGGSGWDAYNLIAPSGRAKLRAMIAQMGGAGDADVVRVLEKTIRDRRDRGIVARPATVKPCDGDRCPVTFPYSDGTSDDFEAVREDGLWWIVLPL